MNPRIALVLLVLLAILGGGALLVRERSGSQKVAEDLGRPLLGDLKAADIAAISIREPGTALTIRKEGERWTIAERGGFPADRDKVRDFVIKAIGLKVRESEPIGAADRARLKLDAGGTAVEFDAAGGKPLARLVAGKKYFKTEPEDAAKALGDGRYVALAGEEKRVFLIADPLAQASTKSADWISKTGFAIEKVKTLELRFAEGGGWKIERAVESADWKLAGAAAGEKLEVTRANSAAYSLSLIELADVAPKDAQPETTGLAKPTLVTAATFEGLSYALKIGKLEGDNYYAALAVSGEAKPGGKDAEERLKKLNERLPRERALADYTVLIPKSKLEDTLKKRPELLAAPQGKKK